MIIDQEEHIMQLSQELQETDEKMLRLWALLEEVAVVDDMTDGDDASFRAAVRALAFKRFEVLSAKEWDGRRYGVDPY